MPRRLSGADAIMLRLDRGNAYNHTLKISILDPSTDPDGWSWPKFRRLFAERIHLLAPLRCRFLPTPLGLHQPIWVEDPEFDLDTHLRRVVCPPPGDMPGFCQLIEQVYARPLDRRRPLWETWIVEGLEGARVGIVSLVHHAYADGIGALKLLQSVYTTEPDDADREIPAWSPSPLPTAGQRLVWALRDLPQVAARVPHAVGALRDRRRYEREHAASGRIQAASPHDSSHPRPFQRGLSRNRRFACDSLALDDLREAKSAFAVTINDVFLSCTAGSLRRYFERTGTPLERSIVGTMPLAVVPLDQRRVPGNFSSVDYTWLHPEIADPVDRLRATRESAQATKEHFAETKDADVRSLLDVIPGGLVSAMAWLNERTNGRFDPFSNVLISNVPGPREPLFLGRWRLDRWFSTGQLTHGATLNLTVWSYCDQLNLCALADAAAVPDAWPIVQGFRASLEELLSVAHRGGSGQESPRPREVVR
jgi:diacylglycerol O-acyltransferase / wax synthase